MTEQKKPAIGSTAWQDLTVENAEEIKEFYCDVIGWNSEAQYMGEYHDFNIMTPKTGETVTRQVRYWFWSAMKNNNLREACSSPAFAGEGSKPLGGIGTQK